MNNLKLCFISFSFLLLCFVNYSCSPNEVKNEETNFIATLLETSEFSIPISQSSNYLPRRMGYYEIDGKEYIITENEATNNIEVYSIQDKTLVKSVPLQVTGPNSIKCIKGFHPISLDSFLVFCPSAYTLTLIDGNGEKLDNYLWVNDPKVKKNPSKYGVSQPYMLAGNMGIEKNDTIFVPAVTMADYGDPNAFNDFFSSQWFHFPSKTSGFVYKYPDLYKEHNFNHLTTQIFRTINSKGHFVYSFQATPEVFETNLNDLNKRHNAVFSSIPQPEAIPTRHENTTPADMTKYAALSSNYKHIMFDKHRNVYYRIVEGPGKITNSLRTAHYDSDLGVIILDDKLNKIGEIKLPFQKYTYRNVFVGKEGLYLSKAHPMNNNAKETSMTFGIFQLKINE